MSQTIGEFTKNEILAHNSLKKLANQVMTQACLQN